MIWSIAITVVGFMLIAAALGMRRFAPRPGQSHSLLSPVTQQHLHLFQGGRLCEAAVLSEKATLSRMLASGDHDRAEAALRPGLQYAVQVQALAEIGNAPAAELLHRQLQRRVSADPVEQSWYWIDVAHSLRLVNNEQSLSHLLRCPANGDGAPLGQFFAAEAVCCPGFIDALRHPTNPMGRAAVRLLHSTLRGLRHGVSPHAIADGKLGIAVATLWTRRPERIDPRVVRVLIEALRLLQRSGHAAQGLLDNEEAISKQCAEIEKCSGAFADYLSDAPSQLLNDLADSTDESRMDVLWALDDLRADAAAVVLPHLAQWPAADRDLGVRLLRWSRDPNVARWLVDWVDASIHPVRRAKKKPRSSPPSRLSFSESCPYPAVLSALRGHPTRVVEELLQLAARDWDPTIRAVAIGNLGWWEPLERTSVLRSLQLARADANADVRRAAEAALARLGERRALQTIRGWLVGDADARVAEAIRFIAAERIYWLWSELDAAADRDDPEIAAAAREALEQMREDLAGGLLAN
jgi:hypothetical protein